MSPEELKQLLLDFICAIEAHVNACDDDAKEETWMLLKEVKNEFDAAFEQYTTEREQ